MRKPLVATRLVCPDERPTIDQAIDPTVNTTKPQPVTRAPRLAAVIMAAIMVAIGATQPAISSRTSSHDPKHRTTLQRAPAMLVAAEVRSSRKSMLTYVNGCSRSGLQDQLPIRSALGQDRGDPGASNLRVLIRLDA